MYPRIFADRVAMRRSSRSSTESEVRKTKPCERRGCQELMADLHCLLELSPRSATQPAVVEFEYVHVGLRTWATSNGSF